MQLRDGVTYPSDNLSEESLAAETFYVLENFFIPFPILPLSQEELDELSVESDDCMKEPTSPLGSALSRRKHSKTRVKDAESKYWNVPMPQEELDGYTIGCEWNDRVPSSPEASLLRIRKNLMFSKKVKKCDPLQCLVFDEGADSNFNIQGGESPMSKALRKKATAASSFLLREEAPEDGSANQEEEHDSCGASESEILRRKKHMASQKSNLLSFDNGQLFAATDETEVQDGSESPMSKGLRRKAMLKIEQEKEAGEAFKHLCWGSEHEGEQRHSDLLGLHSLSPTNVEFTPTNLLRREKQNQLAATKPLHEPNFYPHIQIFTESSESPESPSPMTRALNSRPNKFKKIEAINPLELPSVPDSAGSK